MDFILPFHRPICLQGGAKTGPLVLWLVTLGSIGQIGTKFGTNLRYFILDITVYGNLFESTLKNKVAPIECQ